MAHQWNELCNALRMANKDELISFFEVLSIEGNQQNLTELEQSLVESFSQTFECNIGVARELFGRLLGLKTWTILEKNEVPVSMTFVIPSYATVSTNGLPMK